MPFGQTELVPFREHFELKEIVTITAMYPLGNTIWTEFGEGEPVMMDIEHPVKGGTYCIFGQALLSQAKSLKPSDFPARVAMVEVANKASKGLDPSDKRYRSYKILVTAEELEKGRTDDDIPF